MKPLIAVLCAVACNTPRLEPAACPEAGPSTQGPAGPQGPPGPAGAPGVVGAQGAAGAAGTAFEFNADDVPTGYAVSASTGGPIWTDVGVKGRAQLPSDAKSVYVEVRGCVLQQDEYGMFEVTSKGAKQTRKAFLHGNPLPSYLGCATLDVWLPLDDSQTVRLGFSGAAFSTFVHADLTVLGWAT